MFKKTILGFAAIISFSLFIPGESHSCLNNLCKIVSPERRAKLSSYPVEIALKLCDKARPETLRVFLNRNNISQKFYFDEAEGVWKALVGPEDGLRICEKGKRGWRLKGNTFRASVRGPGWTKDIDWMRFWVKVDAMKSIGPEGGVVRVTDPDSSIYGAEVEIPEGALQQGAIISIAVESDPPSIPDGFSAANAAIRLSTTEQFLEQVKITFPFN